MFEIDGDCLVDPKDGEWTVSAAALYLLRTLEDDHTVDAPLFEQLIPHCGLVMPSDDGDPNACIIECPYGVDFEIVHRNENVEIRAVDSPQKIYSVLESEWRSAVLKFSEKVHEFYDSSSPKIPSDVYYERGFETFMQEWKQRVETAICA